LPPPLNIKGQSKRKIIKNFKRVGSDEFSRSPVDDNLRNPVRINAQQKKKLKLNLDEITGKRAFATL